MNKSVTGPSVDGDRHDTWDSSVELRDRTGDVQTAEQRMCLSFLKLAPDVRTCPSRWGHVVLTHLSQSQKTCPRGEGGKTGGEPGPPPGRQEEGGRRT